jgi:hypothetical protein
MISQSWKISSNESEAVMGLVDTFVRWKQKKESRNRKYEQYHPSEFGSCLRRMQYMRYVSNGLIEGQEEEFTSKQIRLFDKGNNMHSRWQKYFADMGVLRGNWKCSNPFCKMYESDGKMIKYDESIDIQKKKEEYASKLDTRVFGTHEKLGSFNPVVCNCGCRHFIYNEVKVEDKELNIFGHADLILDFSKIDVSLFKGTVLGFNKDNLPINPVVIDMKTCNDYRFKQLGKDGPSIEYIIQLTIYENILDCPFGLLIYENKNTSDVLCFKIEKNTDTIFKIVKMQVKAMNEMAQHVPPLLPPPRCRNKDDYECTNKCGFIDMCHKSKIWEDTKLEEKRNKFYGELLV